MYSLWIRREKISENRRIKLYRAFVKPCLTYNRAIWGLTKALASEIDRCHRRQLRSLIGIRFPNRISNIDLYQRCREEPLSATIEKARMRMVGHALRLSSDTPAQQAMSGYFTPQQRGFKGRPRKPAIVRGMIICCSDYSVRRQPCSQDLDGYVASAAHSSSHTQQPSFHLPLTEAEFQSSRFVKYLSCAVSNLKM